MDGEGESLAGSSWGLSEALASAGIHGVDLSALGAGFSGRQAASIIADVEAPQEVGYEDDVSDDELPAEDAAAAARRRGEEERYLRKARAMMPVTVAPVLRPKVEETPWTVVQRVWPEFERGTRLKMSEVFYETPAARRGYELDRQRVKRRRLGPREEYTVKVAPPPIPPIQSFTVPTLDSLPVSQPNAPMYEKAIGAMFDPKWTRDAKRSLRQAMTVPPPDLDLREVGLDSDQVEGVRNLDLLEWEKDIITCTLNRPEKPPSDPLKPRNTFLERSDFLDDIIWDSKLVKPSLVESDEEDDLVKLTPSQRLIANGKSAEKLDPYNLSNDHIYEQSRDAKYRIRQTFGAIEVFHSGPAKVLQMPWYKTSLTKAEARAWRRPTMQFPIGVTLSFAKLKSNPAARVNKKKAVQLDPSDRFKSSKDLTLAEKGPFVLLEFSEEYPPIMSGYGMGTTIVNYYRKNGDKDDHVPKLDLGQPSILNSGDADPYLLAYVDKGKVTQVIHNNLLRSAIWRHQPEQTDFLVVRQTIKGNTQYYIRNINNLYVVGQTVPNESEVPGPHARKNTTTARLRLMIIAWLLINASSKKQIKIDQLLKYFPDQTELQMRQRLKIKGNEFLVYARKGNPRHGHWLLNPEYEFPTTRAEVTSLVTPEAAMLYEAMQVGAQHLRDAGYAKTAEGKDERDREVDDEESAEAIEQKLAVWRTTLNYKRTEAQKSWIVVHGEGDPTGRGEGWSFLRRNMKNYFLRKGETDEGRRLEAEAKAGNNPVKISNTAQNRIYEEEKRRVWDLQAASLSSSVPPSLEAEDDSRSAPTPAALGPKYRSGPQGSRRSSSRAFSRENSIVGMTPFESPRENSPSQMSGDGESMYTGNPNAGKVMRIKRVIKGKEHVEVVRDPAVIKSYLRRVEERKITEFRANLQFELANVAPTGNPDEDRLRIAALEQELEKIKKNQGRRAARDKYMNNKKRREGQVVDFPDPLGDEGEDSGKRKCSACGQYGHTRANRSCPMYNATTLGPSPASATTTPGPGATSGGFAAYDYFAAGAGSGSAEAATPATPSTTLKIRLGAGK